MQAVANFKSLEAKNLEPQTEQKTFAGESSLQDAKGKIVEFSFWQLKQGYSKATIKGRVKLLYRLMRLGTNFSDEESVKTNHCRTRVEHQQESQRCRRVHQPPSDARENLEASNI
jgi:hypothetical protein